MTESSGVNENILVYMELDKCGLAEVGFELIGIAAELSEKCGTRISAIVVGEITEAVRNVLSFCPIEEAFLYDVPGGFRADLYEQALTDCALRLKPSVILTGGTTEGRTLAPRVAACLRTGITADCTELDMDENRNLIQVRPAFGGNIMAKILTPEKRPKMVTVRPGIFKRSLPPAKGNVVLHDVIIDYKKSRVTLLESTDIPYADKFSGANVIIVAGGGVKSKEDLQMFSELAVLMGGVVASSRALVEKGWMPAEQQIGLSGKSVNPKYLLTFGVSGSVQFLAGVKNAGTIIAVDSNPAAFIFGIAHYPVCADMYLVIPKMIKMLRQQS